MTAVAVVGAGHWGKNLVRNFARLPDADLAYVCDLDPDIRGRMAALYPATRITGSFAEVLADDTVDAVVIATAAPSHFPLARRALAAGRHTFVEKPLTLGVGDAAELERLAADVDRNLMVGHLMEYHGAVNYMKELMDGGEIGDPLYLYLQRVNLGVVRTDENAWWSLAPHDISIACYLFGADPVRVSASGHAYLQQGIEDVVFASLTFPDGRMAHIHVSWLDPHKIRKVTLVGSSKMLVLDDMQAGEQVRIYDKGAVVPGVDSFHEAITLRVGDIRIPKLPAAEPLQAECQHFLDSIRDDRQPRSDGADGLRVVKVLQAGADSLRQGGVPVDLQEEAT